MLYGCEMWSVTLREKHILQVLEKKVLHKMHVTKSDEVGRAWVNFVTCTPHLFYD
jgi:hypothetical protein